MRGKGLTYLAVFDHELFVSRDPQPADAPTLHPPVVLL